MARTRKDTGRQNLRLASKVALTGRIWLVFFIVSIGVRRRPLPQFVQRLSKSGRESRLNIHPQRLGRIVHRVLGVGSLRPRCLILALVLFKLLRSEGVPAEIVIGLPERPKDKNAHAWIEVDGVDVGPPPGRAGHEELVRYP